MIESVYDLPATFDWSPESILATVQAACDADDLDCVVFDLAAGLYWYCYDWHDGVWSDLYCILSNLDYTPGMAEYTVHDAGDSVEFVYRMIKDQA